MYIDDKNLLAIKDKIQKEGNQSNQKSYSVNK